MSDKRLHPQENPEIKAMPTPPTSRARLPSEPRVRHSVSISGHTVSQAVDIADLEACLALERSQAWEGSREGVPIEGMETPAAVPYCDFLMLRTLDFQLVATCRLIRLAPEVSFANPLTSGSFRLSPFLTAMRYTRMGTLEVGRTTALSVPGHEQASRLLWHGMLPYLERHGIGFVMGREWVPWHQGMPADVPGLLEGFGLHPDLELEAREAFPMTHGGPGRGAGSPGGLPAWLPPGLRKALGSGCRLAGGPALHPTRDYAEFVWVASRDMLRTGRDGQGG